MIIQQGRPESWHQTLAFTTSQFLFGFDVFFAVPAHISIYSQVIDNLGSSKLALKCLSSLQKKASLFFRPQFFSELPAALILAERDRL